LEFSPVRVVETPWLETSFLFLLLLIWIIQIIIKAMPGNGYILKECHYHLSLHVTNGIDMGRASARSSYFDGNIAFCEIIPKGFFHNLAHAAHTSIFIDYMFSQCKNHWIRHLNVNL